jgi:hypothetical protein
MKFETTERIFDEAARLGVKEIIPLYNGRAIAI